MKGLTRLAPRSLVASLAALALASCATEVRYGQLDLLLTDAPGDVVTAVVTIDQVYLQGGEEEGAGRLVLRDEDVTTDLLTLANSTADLVTAVDVPVGNYHQLRFVISGAYIEVENADGSTTIYASSPDYAGLPVGAVVGGSLQMPSLASSGLKVTIDPGAVVILPDQTTALVVDFDVAASFGHATGGSGGWVLHPVIHAAPPPPAVLSPAPPTP